MARSLEIPTKCHACGGSVLYWDYYKRDMSGVVNGICLANDIRIEMFLGCEFCSETVYIVDLHTFIDVMNIRSELVREALSPS